MEKSKCTITLGARFDLRKVVGKYTHARDHERERGKKRDGWGINRGYLELAPRKKKGHDQQEPV